MSIVDTTRDETTFAPPAPPAPTLAPRAAIHTSSPLTASLVVAASRRTRIARFLSALAHSGTLDRRGFAAHDRGAYQEYLASAQRTTIR